MLNSIKTEDQRMTVEIGMDCIMPEIEIANDILYDAWEEFFGNVPQQSISALEAERLGRILYAAFDMTSNGLISNFLCQSLKSPLSGSALSDVSVLFISSTPSAVCGYAGAARLVLLPAAPLHQAFDQAKTH